MALITPVLMAGGSGARLWPVSRESYPKQFAPLIGNETLFQATARRLAGPDYADPIVMTNSDFRFIVAEQLDQINQKAKLIVIEPERRNTAPSVLAAALLVAKYDAGGLILICPSDHVIPDTAKFDYAVQSGVAAASQGRIVVFGVAPDRPETGYGYLEVDGQDEGPCPLTRFVEKPNAEAAQEMLLKGGFLWNAGIFLTRADTLIEAFRKHAPEYLVPTGEALTNAHTDLGFLRLDHAPWKSVPDKSIDYAVMEKAENLTLVRYSGRWSDLGSWDSVWREELAAAPSNTGVAVDKNSTAIDCENVLLRSDSDDMQVVGIGLRDTMVVATSDAVLVAGKDRAEDVRLAVDALRKKNKKQATTFRRDHRPWGWFETLAIADRFQVKRIVVTPGASLSLQSHVHRSEHWVVVSGTAKAMVDDKVALVTENQSIYVPLGSRHRLENPGKVPMVLIEVQTGAYLGEDDIVRHQDIYSRIDQS